MQSGSDTTATSDQLRIAQLESEIKSLAGKLAQTEHSLDRVRVAYTQALEQLQLINHRLFVAKAERTPAHADQLALDTVFAHVQQLARTLAEADAAGGSNGGGDDGAHDPGPKGDAAKKKTARSKPTGRRDLSDTDLPVVRVEVPDPLLEGLFERIGFEESSRLGYERGGMRRIVVARGVYKIVPDAPDAPVTAPSANDSASDSSGEQDRPGVRIVTAPLPRELLRRSFLTASMIAHLLTQKYMMGVPFYRLEQKFALEGVTLDRGTMCRYAEDAGATLGAIVLAARDDAFANAFCLSTDATGVSIQPGALADRGGERGPCRKGHFFVVLADRDHVFFEFQPKHTQDAVCTMFKGFKGYIQADAHTVYDALFSGETPKGGIPDPVRAPPPTEVGCWSHARRYFWEAAICKLEIGVQGLRRIDAIFAMDRTLADLAPAVRKERRDRLVRPLIESFFAWAGAEHAVPRERGLIESALGYALRQQGPLTAFLADGRLRLENNGSERALRTIAVGRAAWLFFGSDDHANAAANLFSLIASCKLHRLDPETYLTEVMRVMAAWPRERYLELTPKHWARTRARLDPTEMAKPYGHVTVPAKE